MPCARCKSAGKIIYGHWKDDPECPLKSKQVNEVSADGPSFLTDVVVVMALGCRGRLRRESSCGKAVLDCACARTVGGLAWLMEYLEVLKYLGIQWAGMIVQDQDAFRFGPGERVTSLYAVWLPIVMEARVAFWLRVAIVDEDDPLLMSRGAFKALGGVVDLNEDTVHFKKINVRDTLATTTAGHIACDII